MFSNFKKWYGAHLERFIPDYAFFSLIGCFAFNCIVYWVTQFVETYLFHYNFTTAFDNAVPFVPGWVLIYVLSFPFWVVGYAMTAKHNTRDNWFRFVFADMLARVVCGVFFILIPTTNVRPEIVGDGFFDWLMELIYTLDVPYNLFPSIHCLASLMCYLGVRKSESAPAWYKGFTLIFAILIFASTQFTKQHYIVDVAGGVAVAIICYELAMRTNWYRKLMTAFERLNQKTFGEVTDEEK